MSANKPRKTSGFEDEGFVTHIHMHTDRLTACQIRHARQQCKVAQAAGKGSAGKDRSGNSPEAENFQLFKEGFRPMSGLYCANVQNSFVQGKYNYCQRRQGLGLDRAVGHNKPK